MVDLQYAYDNSTDTYRLYAATSGAGYGLYVSTDFGDNFFPLLTSGVTNLAVSGSTDNTISPDLVSA